MDGDRSGRLTGAAGGVRFDAGGDGTLDQVAWTEPGSDEAWLALDRNGNGRIDHGRELFGNLTEQPPSEAANGFRALAVFDTPAEGGNGDGFIDAQDAIWASLRLWQDGNHNGISEAGELMPLTQVGVVRLGLEYRAYDYTDPEGNVFRYASLVQFQAPPRVRMAWDVILQISP